MHVAGPQLGRQTIALLIEQQRRVKTGGLEVTVVGALLLLSVHRNLRRVHIQDRPVTRVHGFRLPDQSPVESCQSGKVLLLDQHLGFEALQARGQSRPSIPDLLRTDQPKGWVLGKPLRVVEVFVARQAAVHRLPQQVGKRKLRVLATTGIGQMLLDQFSKSQPLVELAHQDQATVGSDARTLEIDLERGVEGGLKRLL